MELVVTLFTIVAGVIYFLYRFSHDEPDGFKGTLALVAIIAGPYALWRTLMDSENQAVVIFGAIMLVVHIIVVIAYPHFDSKNQHTRYQKSVEDYKDCYRIKVEKLPEPDEETIRRYKIKTGQSLDPEFDSVSRPVALRAWRADKGEELIEKAYKARRNANKTM